MSIQNTTSKNADRDEYLVRLSSEPVQGYNMLYMQKTSSRRGSVNTQSGGKEIEQRELSNMLMALVTASCEKGRSSGGWSEQVNQVY
jgi:hypothetical protein